MTPSTVFHGGDLADVMAPGDDPADWLDLSTGINPSAYPLPDLSPDIWSRLPSRAGLDRLLHAAAKCYGAPGADCVAAAPGSQALIQLLPALFTPRRIAIVAPTYGEHGPAWASAGHEVHEVESPEAADPGEIAVLVNPNNPDGRHVGPDRLIADARRRSEAGGVLVVDEAFADTAPELSMAAHVGAARLVVLRSFGKFFGLAGLRLGFALSSPALTRTLDTRLGPWAVSGPAIAIGTAALSDTEWQAAERLRLAAMATRLDAALSAGGLKIVGGTTLFRLTESRRAEAIFERLLARRIHVRRFPHLPNRLRFGLPADGTALDRLQAALQERE